MTNSLRCRTAASTAWLIALLAFLAPTVQAQISWTTITGLPGENIMDVWASSPSNVYASGGYRTLNHFDGTDWSAEAHPSGANRYHLYGISPNEIYSAGQAGYQTGNIMKYDGTLWSTIYSTPLTEIVDVWSDGAGNIFAVGDGRFFKFDGFTWTEVATGLSTGFNVDRIHSVWGTDASNVYAVGYNGNFLHWNGSTLSVSNPFGTGVRLNQIAGGSSDNIWAVGSGGSAFHFDGTSWTQMTTGTSADLFGIFLMTPTELLISGAGGTLLKGYGTSLAQIDSGTDRDLQRIQGLREGDMDYWWVAASGVGRLEGGVILYGTETIPSSAVPEPATLTLTAMSLGSLALARRRKRG